MQCGISLAVLAQMGGLRLVHARFSSIRHNICNMVELVVSHH